ncbi:MAG: peptide deformylase [Actinomycetota bacterium]|nr:peptide deformylase [Actinomycetota bacterium]
MAVRAVVRLPERVLKIRCDEMGEGDAGDLVRDLLDTMEVAPACVGLAAPQIGVSQRVIVVDVSSHPKATTCSGTIVLVDPIVVEYSGRVVGREGCMSVPDLTANVARATEITVAGRDAAGDRVHLHAQGFEARALQHEIDHLDGMLILDRVESVTSDVFRRKVYK